MREIIETLTQHFYRSQPEWVSGSSHFGNLVRKHLRSEHRVLDLGAGSGKLGPINFRSEARTVVGIDPDSYITNNCQIDLGVIGQAEYLPFRGNSFDLVVCDWVVEHLAQPQAVAAEVFRILKPSGRFIFRTGNVRHYSYAIAATTPHWFHRLVANRVRGLQHNEADTHPTYYLMNTPKAARRYLNGAGFLEEQIIMVEPEPSYLMFSVPSFLLGVGYERVVNRSRSLEGLRACILASFRKPLSRCADREIDADG
jgi:SAM-dependent methyltransferase